MATARTLLIDADIFIFRMASAVESAIEWEPGQWSITADADEAARKLDDLLTSFQDQLQADRLVLAMKDTTAPLWRRSVLPAYKANRSSQRPPIIRGALMAHCEAKYETFARPTLEGDDILGILATSKVIVKGEKIIVSIDKDMKSIPGLSWNPDKPELGVVIQSEAEADYQHMVQTLTGDRTDNYDGCPGVGPVKAEKILKAPYTWITDGQENEKELWWRRIVDAYAKAGKTPEDALTQARVARICRVSDYDFKRKEVILWEPPNSAVI